MTDLVPFQGVLRLQHPLGNLRTKTIARPEDRKSPDQTESQIGQKLHAIAMHRLPRLVWALPSES